MKVTIDRIEGAFAVVEKDDRTTENLPVSLLPEGAREGSVIDISLDENEERLRRERIRKKAESLWRSDD